MPVGLAPPGNLKTVSGVELAAGACGLKSTGADDLLLISLAENSVVAGVFTQNAYCAAPVTIANFLFIFFSYLVCSQIVILHVMHLIVGAGFSWLR